MIKDLQCCLLNPFNNFSLHSDVSLAFKGIDVYEVVFETTFDLRSVSGRDLASCNPVEVAPCKSAVMPEYATVGYFLNVYVTQHAFLSLAGTLGFFDEKLQ